MKNSVEVLLKRMESNPAEFIQPASKWRWAVAPVIRRAQQGYPQHTSDLPCLSNDEVRKLYESLLVIEERAFSNKVLETLLAEPDPERNYQNVDGSKYVQAELNFNA